MGMGEPFLNYADFIAAVRLLTQMPIPESRMTVSTSGILPGISTVRHRDRPPQTRRQPQRLQRHRPRIHHAHHPQMEHRRPTRSPGNHPASHPRVGHLRVRPPRRHQRLTGARRRTHHLVGDMRCKINLIVWNSGPNMPFHEPPRPASPPSRSALWPPAYPRYIRRPRGRDIYAACGQLKRTLRPLAHLIHITSAESRLISKTSVTMLDRKRSH